MFLGVWHRVDVGAHHAHFIILLVQIVEQGVAERYHANQVAFVANGQVTETVAPHQGYAVFQVLVHADRKGSLVMTSAIQVLRGSRPSADDAFHEVPFGKNSDQFAIVQCGNRTDVVFDHDLYGLQYGVAHFRTTEKPAFALPNASPRSLVLRRRQRQCRTSSTEKMVGCRARGR